ncbi:MAG: glycine oxidase ThiO [Candidatus Omnitrophica bacterium]|nr:glycine oxidase ThiO [Candidatus Omnitrophota bacterium]
MSIQTEVLIVGGGVIGCAIARELAQEGISSTILERGEPCREASWAAAGALIARANEAEEGPLLAFKQQSLGMFEDLCSELREETGIDSGFRKTGGIDLFPTEEDIAQSEEFLGWQRKYGIEVERLSASDLRRMEPNLTDEIEHGALFPKFTQVRTPWFTRALLTSALKKGAKLETHTEVLGFITEGDRVVGVKTDREECFADTVILAAGPWSQALSQLLGREIPGVPVKGQIILLNDRSRPVEHIVHYGKTYLTPRDEGRIVVGSTEEWVGFQRRNTLEGIAHLLTSAKGFFPCLDKSSVEDVWHGFRPLTLDGLPFIGPFEGLEGFLCATGHYRSGIILSPITARVVAESMLGKPLSFDVSPFTPNRVHQMEGIDLSPRSDLH